jgi:hypothetical protein
MASSFLIRVRNAYRVPLPDRVDIDVVRNSTGARVALIRDVSGKATQRVTDLNPGEAYIVRVFPLRHRPVGQFAMAPQSGDADVTIVCPIHPERVLEARFPAFHMLVPQLAAVLDRSRVEGTGDAQGALLWDRFDLLQRAGLMNLHAKMHATLLPGGASTWSFVDTLYRVRGDRLFADVQRPLRDAVKSAVAAGNFREVSGKLHTPPPGFQPAGSFKTLEPYGNLQLSFFSSIDAPLRFRVDADIDDAAGIRHAFQVLRNWLTDSATHPYDIQQILVFQQQADPGYELLV